MADKPSTAAEKALQKIQDQITCGICLELYKEPKLLKCFHVYCEQCLQHLVHGGQEGQSLLCPQCRQDTPLPVGGVSALQGAFYIHNIQDALKKMDSKDKCSVHPKKETEFYCEQCDRLICSRCLVSGHRDHQYDLVPESFAKFKNVIADSLKPVREQIGALERAVKSVNTRCAAVIEQKKAVVTEIHTAMAHLRQALEVRETELVGEAEETAQQKLKTLAAQQEEFEVQLRNLRSCLDSVEEKQHNCSEGEILRMKSPILKQVKDVTDSLKTETLVLAECANLKFAHSLPGLTNACQQFGKLYCHPVVPEKCRASGVVNIGTRGQTVAFSVEALDREGKPCLRPVDSLKCELVASDGSSRVRGTVKRRNQNIYDISYRPRVAGKHQLHILIEKQPILNSPFTVTVLPNFTAPENIIVGFDDPRCIAFIDGGEMVVAEYGGNCVSIMSGMKKKKSFGHFGKDGDQVISPEGIAIVKGSILVADCDNHRLQLFWPTGGHLKTVGTSGSGPLQFQQPRGITDHPHNSKVYIADYGNHRIQVLNFNFTYFGRFGREGSNNGEFRHPYGITTDREGNVYVCDCDNHRIQVFTAKGVYLRQFGNKGEGEGELNQPISIAIDSGNVVYVGELGNQRVSIFTTVGRFLKSFECGPENIPFGLALDKRGKLYVSSGKKYVKIFH